MNAATAAAHFDLPAAPLPTCGNDLCFACLHGVCPAAAVAERASLEAHAPEMSPLSDAEIAAIGDALDADTLTLAMEAA